MEQIGTDEIQASVPGQTPDAPADLKPLEQMEQIKVEIGVGAGLIKLHKPDLTCYAAPQISFFIGDRRPALFQADKAGYSHHSAAASSG